MHDYGSFLYPLIHSNEVPELEAQIAEKVYGWERFTVWVDHTKFGPDCHSSPRDIVSPGNIGEVVDDAYRYCRIDVSSEIADLAYEDILRLILSRAR